jgi:hypothetical protein
MRIFNVKHRLHKFAQIEIERQSVCIFYPLVSVALKKIGTRMSQIKRMDADFFYVKHRLHRFTQIEIERLS